MPFWDDVKVSALPELSGKLIMIETTDKPVRFRFGFGVVGAEVKDQYGRDRSMPSSGRTCRNAPRGIRLGLAIDGCRGETREDFTDLEQCTGAQYRFVLPGPHFAEQEWRICLAKVRAIGLPSTIPNF